MQILAENGDFTFEVVKSSRKTISISVNRDAKVVIRTPKNITDAKIREIIAIKKQWILKKIAQISQSNARPSQANYQETGILFFLGERYAIKFSQGKTNFVTLEEGFVCVQSKNYDGISVLEKWLKGKSLEIFSQRLAYNFEIFSQMLSYNFPILKIRKMKSRWGSMLSGRKIGVMTLNLNLIHKQIKHIDYVIMHELCHLKFPNHGADFYNLQRSFVPNWRELKALL